MIEAAGPNFFTVGMDLHAAQQGRNRQTRFASNEDMTTYANAFTTDALSRFIRYLGRYSVRYFTIDLYPVRVSILFDQAS